MAMNELLTIVTLWLIVPGLHSQMDDINRCVYEVNERDLVANCSSGNLTAVPQGFVKNVTVIDLTMNKITSIGKMSFPYRLKVHTLSLHQNLLTHLDEGSLKNLPELSKLDLGRNRINFTLLPTGLFRGLPLKRLLMSNMSGILNAEYPEDTFLDLHQLQELSIDAPPNPTFGVGFLNMTNLQTLTISFCEKESLNTSAFEVFQKFNLSAFQINACDKGQVDENITDIFPNLDILDIRDTVGTDLPKRLMSLKNYENSSMQRVSFIKNVGGDKDPTEQCNMLTKNVTRYLITMCVSEVYLIGNKIRIIDRGTLIQPPFSECLRFLDLSHNMILDEYGILETLYFYPNLVLFHFEQFLEDLKQAYHEVFHFYDASSIFQDKIETVWPPQNPETCLFTVGAEKRDNEVIPPNESSKRGIYILLFPRNLTSLYFAPALKPFANIEHNLGFFGTEKWSKVRFSNCSVRAKNVKFFGLENLQSLEISGNGFTELPTTFMKSFPNIQNLSLNHITHGFRKISENIDSVLGHLEHLENLQLLGNGLSDLPRNVENLTNIKLIDVSYNSIKELSVETRTRLDAMAQKKNVWVNLRGNVLSCGCDSLEFILWSMDSKVNFADDKHYTCRNDNGTIIHVTDIAHSFMKIWRECISLFSLLFSICLVFLFLLGVSLSLHIARNINLIKRWSVRWLGLDFQRHFKYDVFVYYSSKEDPQWVCSTLRQKLEDERELRLCIPERDFDPGVYTCEEVLGAINQSWKTIIYLTQTFLEDELCSFRLSSAIYVGENLTSDRFIILYSDAVFRHPLPSIINQLLDKDNRFPIERFHESSLWDQLHSRILCKD
ncbi:toll-like receptor 4 [Haliotis rubra]|uniref:toll-like receptor 4 n=1 Tax=Haliotis rubra TaxID=36100 RepID=UPI001EE5AFA2|nr:toll-like receptor 4 [Haliotis rubra]